MGSSGTTPVGDDVLAERLFPYLPRLAVDWLRSAPDTTARHVDGSMVFIDVSGFTALSERLARRGKAGAEELTDVLDTIFTRLLTRAWDLGGGLVKFGGDALLLLFTGADHPRRACAAAFDLRAELAELGRLRTSAGPVTLQMSVGVHSGGFDFFLVGGSHRELVLAGPAATMTVEAEGAAQAGQILLSADTAVLVDPDLLGEAVGPGRLLVGRPHAPDDLLVSGELTGLPLASCVPMALRRHLVSGAFEPEHRVVTVGFLHFQGVDRLLAEEGMHAAAQAIEAVVKAVQEHLDEQEICFLGSDVYGDGGKLILTAGAPTTHGNDEERLLRALRGVFERDLPLAIRAGVNRGHVYAGEVGPEARRTYTVMGDAVNLAARLMQAAAPGSILATGPVLDRSETTFQVSALRPFHVKGKSRQIQAYEVGPVAGVRGDVATTRLPLVGREGELARLEAAVEAARRSRGQVVQVAGPAGIGKTRLVEEVRSRLLPGFRQYRIGCQQYEATTAYWPYKLLLRRLIDIPLDAEPDEAGPWLERYVRDAAPALLPWLPLLAMVIDGRVDPTDDVDQLDESFRRAQLERAVLSLLDGLMPDPAAVFLEDAYWMDEASRSLTRAIGNRAAERPWLLAMTVRDTDQSIMPDDMVEHAHVIRLAALQREDMRALAMSASEGSPKPVHELEALTERAGGSPLFLIELLAGAASGIALPDSIEAAITARIDTLEPPDRMVLRCASVLGRPSFPLQLAAEVLTPHAPAVTDPGVWDRLAEFLVREGNDSVSFQHVLIRDVAYEGLAFRRRREIHGSVAEWVARESPDPDEQAELLALHALQAEWFDWALRYSRVAGDRARAKAATADAAAFYRQALDATDSLDDVDPLEVAALGEALGEVCEAAGLYDEGARGYRLARHLVRDDLVRRADLLRKEGFLCDRAARYGHARLLYRAGLAVLDRTAPDTLEAVRIRAKLEVVMAAALYWEGRRRAEIWWARRAAARAEKAGVKEVLGHAYYRLDAAFTDLGLPESAEYRGRALPIFEELGDLVMQATVLNNLGANAYYEGQWDAALDFYERSRRASEKAGDVVEAATAASNIAEVLCQQGQPAKAEGLFQESLRVFRGAGYGAGTAWVTGYLGLVAARLGRAHEGLVLLRESRESCRQRGMEGLALESSVRLVEATLLADDAAAASALVEPTRLDIRSSGLRYLEASLGRLEAHILAHLGDLDAASRIVEVTLHLAETADASYEVALCLDTKARLAELLGRPDDGAADRAAGLFAELGVTDPPRIPLPELDDRTKQRPRVTTQA